MLTLLVIFGIIYPSTADYEVCQGCIVDGHCPSEISGIEACLQLGNHFEKVCYWKNSNIIEIDAINPPHTRRCSYDDDCREYDNLYYTFGTGPPDDRFSGGCLRCCNALCVETLSTNKGPCGHYEISDITAPCCPGEVCLDYYTGICTELVGECAKCFSFAVTTTEGAGIMGDNCMDGYFCLTDNTRFRYEQSPQQIFYDGVCIPETRISESVSECTENEDCAPCLRCCKNQCVRANGENCGFKIDGRGPCCCPEDECKLDECIINTESPTQTPSQTPITQKPITQKPITQKPITQQPSAPTSASPTKDR